MRVALRRVEESRGLVRAGAASFLPDIDLGANAVRSKPGSAGVAAFGGFVWVFGPILLRPRQR